jgi:hypothetical protein
LVLAIITGFASVTWQLRRISREESITRRNLYTADMNRVQQAWEQGNLQDAQELLKVHKPQAGKADLRGFEWRYLTNLCQDESRFTFTNVHFAGERRGLTLATDGRTVIAASGDTLKWLDWRKPRDVQTTTAGPKAIAGLSMAMDQPGLVAYRTDRIKALSSTREALLGAGLAPEWGGFPDPEWGGAFALSWDGALLAASGTNSTVRIFDVKTGQPLGPKFYLGENEGVLSLAFSPDAKYLACGTLGTKIHILEAPQLKQVHVLTNHTAFVTCLAFDRSGRKLVSGCNDSHILVWTFPECIPVADLTGHQGWIGDLAFSPDGRRAVSLLIPGSKAHRCARVAVHADRERLGRGELVAEAGHDEDARLEAHSRQVPKAHGAALMVSSAKEHEGWVLLLPSRNRHRAGPRAESPVAPA